MRHLRISLMLFLAVLQLTACQKEYAFTETKRAIEEKNDETKENEVKKGKPEKASKESIKTNLEKLGVTVRSYKSNSKETSINYIKEVLQDYGYDIEIQKFSIKQPDTLSAMSENSPEDMFDVVTETREILGDGENIIVKHPENIDGRKTVYITAHYDTTDKTTGVIDNGTGVAVVLEAAKELRQLERNINVVFVLFDAEEVSQQGAKNFVYHLSPEEKENAIGCINIDMVGEIGAGELVMKFGNGEHNILSVLWNHILQKDIDVEMGVMTDEQAFYHGRIPGVTIENYNPDFSLETAENQFQYVDYEQLLGLTNDIIHFIRNFDLDFYHRALDEKIEVESHIERICEIKNAVFKRATAKVVENGFIMETCFYYETDDKREFQMILKNKKFFDIKDSDDFLQISDGEKSIQYKIHEMEGGQVQATFFNEQYKGMIKGNIDRIRCTQIIEDFYEAEYW